MKEPIVYGLNFSSTSQTMVNMSSLPRKPQPDPHPPSPFLTINPITKKTILATSVKSNQSALVVKSTISSDLASVPAMQNKEE